MKSKITNSAITSAIKYLQVQGQFNGGCKKGNFDCELFSGREDVKMDINPKGQLVSNSPDKIIPKQKITKQQFNWIEMKILKQTRKI